jgi:2-beta-glucuronyltransferase
VRAKHPQITGARHRIGRRLGHIIRIGQRIEVAERNIVSYDEMPFRETLPFVQHADIGLHTIAHGPGVESLRDSLKVIQFSYCGKPIIVPSYLASSRPNVVSYRPGDDEDAARAIATALAMKVEDA